MRCSVLLEALAEFLQTVLACSPFDVLKGAVGFAIETLPGDGALLGQLRDRAVADRRRRRRHWQGAESGYDTHGVNFLRVTVGGAFPSLQLLHPSSVQLRPTQTGLVRKSRGQITQPNRQNAQTDADCDIFAIGSFRPLTARLPGPKLCLSPQPHRDPP